MAHPLPNCPGLGDRAELGRHEVPQPVQRGVVPEPAHQRREPLADRIRPPRSPTIRRPDEHVRLRVQPAAELLSELLATGAVHAEQLDRARVERQPARCGGS